MATRGRETVAPGEIVASDWGNAVWDQSVQAFDTAADRTAQFPAPQPGAVTYQADTGLHYVFTGGAWKPLRPAAVAAGTASVTFTGTDQAPTLAVTFPVGRFTTAPSVSIVSSTRTYVAGAAGLSATGFVLGGLNISGNSSSTITYYWTAVERG